MWGKFGILVGGGKGMVTKIIFKLGVPEMSIPVFQTNILSKILIKLMTSLPLLSINGIF